MLTGCPSPNGGNNNGSPVSGTPGTPTEPTIGILNILNNAAFSDAVSITILYSVPADATDVIAFYTLLNDVVSAGGTPIGGEEVIATGLPAGSNQSFLFDTTDLRPGFYRLGIRADGVDYLSQGTVEVQGPPAPLFLEPSADVTARAGEDVTIMVDVGDPQGLARWRLFFQDADAPLLEEGMAAGGELLGVRLTEGEGNTVDFTWDTTNVDPGKYRLGISATDSGFSISEAAALSATSIITAYSDAVVTILPVASEAMPPTIQLTTADQTLFIGDSVDIGIAAQAFEGDEFLVTVYWMLENTTDRTTIATITDPAVVSATFDTSGLQTGLYEIGASISDGLNPVVEIPQADRVKIDVIDGTSADLVVSSPGIDRQVAKGESISIEWDTNIPPGEGRSFRVFARACTACDANDAGTAPDINILTGVELNTTTTTWDTSNVGGRHLIFVELTLPTAELAAPITARAPGVIRVSTAAPQFWLGSIGNGAGSARQGEIYEGVNFQDNAGTFLNVAGDFDEDGRDDFIIGARFGKPFFQNPDGVGIGEAYLIYGGERTNSTHNLNEVSLAQQRGIAFTGVQPRDDAAAATNGLSAVRLIPDQDGDGKPELAFGIPSVESRGHSRRLIVDRNPAARDTLEKENQFRRGGVIFVASTNTKFTTPPNSPDADAPISLRPVVNLDLVGQNFDTVAVETSPGGPSGCDALFVDNWQFSSQLVGTALVETCTANMTDGCAETFVGNQLGFSRALADHFGTRCLPISGGGRCRCFNAANSPPATGNAANNGTGGISHRIDSGGRCAAVLGLIPSPTLTEAEIIPGSPVEDPSDMRLGSGFYPVAGNAPREPFGARLIGNEVGDDFGTSIAVSGGFLIISAPGRTPRTGEVIGLGVGTDPCATTFPTDPGIMYMINMNNLWPDFSVNGSNPPLPFQYQVGPFPEGAAVMERNNASHCGRSSLFESFPSPFRILGEQDEKIQFVEGIADFNGDGREDFVIGAPTANTGNGQVNVVFRRDPFLEGDYLLCKLGLSENNVERLAGLRINGRTGEGFGDVIGKSLVVVNSDGSLSNEGADLNGDGRFDLILGNPNASPGGRAQAGEIIVVFATDDLISPVNGLGIDRLLDPSDSISRDSNGNPRAIKIAGNQPGDQLGFNVAVVGDVDGDGRNDLLVAAPGAAPRFDSDDNGTLDSRGIDIINLANPDSPFGDGIADDADGDGTLELDPNDPNNDDDLLLGAGQVYLILGVNDLAQLADPATNTVDIATLGASNNFRGIVFVGREEGDSLGGGVESKKMGRSFGIGPAGDVDGDGRGDFLLGSILANPGGRVDAGAAYLIYGFSP